MHSVIARLSAEQVKFIREAIGVLKTIEKIRHAIRPNNEIRFSTMDSLLVATPRLLMWENMFSLNATTPML